MKEKIIIFVVGLLLGSIISTASIYVYTIANNSKDNNLQMQMNGEVPPSMRGEFNEKNGRSQNMYNSNDIKKDSQTINN